MIKPLFFSRIPETVASDDDLVQAEQQCGLTFPSAFVEFCRTYNGGFSGPKTECYLVPSKFGNYHSENKDDSTVLVAVFYGLTKDPKMKACDVVKADNSLSWLAVRLFPIARDDLGNEIVINKGQPEGPVFFRDHELWVAEATPKLFQIADNLEEFYNGLGPDSFTKE